MNRGRPTFDAGDQYELYVGRWSRLVARKFVDWLEIPSGGTWLDVGCGTGAVVAAVLAQASPSLVVGIDPSTAFVDYARSRTGDVRATFVVGDAQAILNHLVDFDAVVSGLVLNFINNPQAALDQMVAATKPRGTIAAFVWDYAGQMELMRYFWDAAIELDPAAAAFDEGSKETLCRPAALIEFFSRLLVQVSVTEVVTPTVSTISTSTGGRSSVARALPPPISRH